MSACSVYFGDRGNSETRNLSSFVGESVDIAILIALILLNGVFAMSELALVTVRKSRLQRMADAGDKSALAAIRLGENPTRFLSTIQIGITAIGLLSGIVGEAALSVPLAQTLLGFGLSAKASSMLSTAVVVVAITLFSIVIGELVPKRIAQLNSETIARLMARPIAVLSQLARPFVYLLSVSTDGILHLIGAKPTDGEKLTEEDIHAILADGSQSGLIEKSEHEMLRNVFRMDDRPISTLMTPRSEVVFLDLDEPWEESISELIDSNHSRFPVCKGDVNNVLGVISAKRLLKRYVNHETTSLESELYPAEYVPETMTGMKLLELFRDSGVKMVFVSDEYGEVVGLVTIQNLFVALAGEFKPRDPEDLWAVLREDGSWLLDGLIPIPELMDRLGLKNLPDGQKGHYNTLGGMIMLLAGSMPHTGDTVTWEKWCFEVVDLDGNRVDKVLASRLPEHAPLPADGQKI